MKPFKVAGFGGIGRRKQIVVFLGAEEYDEVLKLSTIHRISRTEVVKQMVRYTLDSMQEAKANQAAQLRAIESEQTTQANLLSGNTTIPC